jgi:predicted Kef-type K+ transport protein
VTLSSDKREFEPLHGRIALGLLIVQVMVVVVAMVVLSTVGIGAVQVQSGSAKLLNLGGWLLRVVAVLILFVRYLANR